MKKYFRVFNAFVAVTFVSVALYSSGVQAQQIRTHEKFKDKLNDIMAEAGENELIPVSIVMQEQADRAELSQARNIQSKKVRRETVINLLKSVASQSQVGLLEFLAERQQDNRVGERVSPLWIHNVVVAKVTRSVALEIANRDDVAYLNDEATMSGEDLLPFMPGMKQHNHNVVPGGPNIECGVELMGAPDVWNEFNLTGEGVVVAVIDTGCCIDHPDIENNLWSNPNEIAGNGIDDDSNGQVDDIHGWNFRDNTHNLIDTNGHGTHTSGTVGGDGTQGTQTGMAPDVDVMVLKYWNSFSGEMVAWECMQYAVDNNADVISGSFGWVASVDPDYSTWRSVSENAMNAGVVVVFAAGNEADFFPVTENVRVPGSVPDMITVGASDCSDVFASFSSVGPVTWEDVSPYNDWPYPPGKPKPTIVAPGSDTESLQVCNFYRTLSGTSMSTPHVAGAVALMLQANPSLDHFEVKQILKDTAVGIAGQLNQVGSGRVDAYEAVVAAMGKVILGDVNGDGEVNLLDVAPFIETIENGKYIAEADINEDGTVDLLDVAPFIDLL